MRRLIAYGRIRARGTLDMTARMRYLREVAPKFLEIEPASPRLHEVFPDSYQDDGHGGSIARPLDRTGPSVQPFTISFEGVAEEEKSE